jgi:hypothetical protein
MLKNLWSILQQRNIVHARGTPACGKTTLARSFERYIKWQEPTLKVLLITWNNLYQAQETYTDKLIRLHPSFFRGFHDDAGFLSNRYLLIIDEAQNSYSSMDFWINYIKSVADVQFPTKPYVLMLSSWSSPSDTPITHINSAPATFEAAKRMSIQPSKDVSIGLYFNEREFNNFVILYARGVEARQNGKYKMAFDTQAIEFLFEFTSGHPGLIKALLALIEDDETVSHLPPS